jgi:hypothetical protein
MLPHPVAVTHRPVTVHRLAQLCPVRTVFGSCMSTTPTQSPVGLQAVRLPSHTLAHTPEGTHKWRTSGFVCSCGVSEGGANSGGGTESGGDSRQLVQGRASTCHPRGRVKTATYGADAGDVRRRLRRYHRLLQCPLTTKAVSTSLVY